MANLRTNNLCGEGGRNALSGSVFFSRTTDYLQIGSVGDHNYLHDGTEDFSVEFWIFPTQSNDRQTVFSTGGNSSSTGFACRIMEDGASGGSNGYKVLCQFSRGSSGNYLGFLGGTVDINSWSHIALQFTTSNKQLKIYVNGVLTNSSDLDGTANGTFGSGNFSSSNSTYAFNIGREPYGNTLYLDGAYISNLRICRGHTVYSSEFTPPTSPLTAHYISENDKTTILCCQNFEDPTQEATGQTITGYGNFATEGYHETQPKVLPPFGTDNGVTFDGAISMNSLSYMYFPTGRTEERGRGRGFYMLGYHGTPGASPGKRIDYVNIQSQGNSIKFGDLTANRYTMGAGANSTRGLFTGGYVEGNSPDTDVNIIEFITIATEGTAIDFGDRTQVGRVPACASNDTRCVMASAFTPSGYQNTIDFVTIASIGNASDFGDLSTARAGMSMSCNSTTRGIFNGGYQPAPSTIRVNNMEYITFATTGNTQDFGDLTDDSQATTGGTASSGTRGLIGLGYVHPSRVNSVDFCTIATTGNASDFGDLTAAKADYGSCSNSIRGLFFGGQTPSFINNIDMVIIATAGDATDFGDVNVGVTALGAAGSDSHGGLS